MYLFIKLENYQSYDKEELNFPVRTLLRDSWYQHLV